MYGDFINCLKMTDLKNIIEISFPYDDVSVTCVIVHIVMFFFSSFFIFIFILVGVGRPSDGAQCPHKVRLIAEIPAKKGKTKYIICIAQYI